ncbi:hypothetical protein [Streptacidiphilus sp. PB12-B1b]|uniref:hypothetical protein n=1 Tax=Streptacidiphilus sp. PB12-B1b TaxID=2705012 RepID=UPI001CDC4168|nr:hypothetical protein [Streptacidiphilus sp. PB12-B1b]
MKAVMGFAAHPDALRDLAHLPDGIRDQALLHLHDLVRGEHIAKPLDHSLVGYHKVTLGTGNYRDSHRLVVQFRDAPAGSAHRREVYLVAAGPRVAYQVYHKAQLRTGRITLHQRLGDDPQFSARAKAALSRSTTKPPATTEPVPAAAAPVPAPSRKAHR